MGDALPTGLDDNNKGEEFSSSSTNSSLDDWIYESGEYVTITLLNQPFLDSTAMLAPQSRPDDGKLFLLIIRGGTTKKNLLKLMLEMEKGRHVTIPGVELIPVRAFRLIPDENNPGKGIMAVDGERVPAGPVQAHIMPAAARLFVK